jgi:hypothetical protein
MSLVAGELIRLVIPSALQMGWNESPAYFCATTDTAGDVAQTWIDTKEPQRRHPMESFTTAAQPARLQSSTSPSYQMLAVYVDDFLLLAAVENKDKLLQRMARHAIHSVFPYPAATGTTEAKDPVSKKKLAKGDARWETSKEILGCMLNGCDRTIQLPPV